MLDKKQHEHETSQAVSDLKEQVNSEMELHQQRLERVGFFKLSSSDILQLKYAETLRVQISNLTRRLELQRAALNKRTYQGAFF